MKEEVDKAAQIIKDGGIILYPTDTVWGLGCDPSNDEGIKRISSLKKRDNSKQFIVIVPDENILHKYVKDVPDICYDLIDMTDKPLTIVYPNGKNLSKLILGDDGSIGIRIVTEPFCKQLMQKLRSGLISTSANFAGEKYPVKFSEVDQEIIQKVDYVVNYGREKKSISPSQIIKINSDSSFKIIRK